MSSRVVLQELLVCHYSHVGVSELQLAAKIIKVRVKITRTNNIFFHTIMPKRIYSCPIALPQHRTVPPYSYHLYPCASHMRKTIHGVKPPSHVRLRPIRDHLDDPWLALRCIPWYK